jgi:serine/threonine protein phosphatase 1
MMPRFFRSRAKPAASPRTPPGTPSRVYAIGDIHGRSDLLDELHAHIVQDFERSPCEEAAIVYLGDYVDRGEDSCGVLERLCAPAPADLPRVMLRGNHEEMMLRFLAAPEASGDWRRLGGQETILSYRVDVRSALERGGLTGLAEEFKASIPDAHMLLLHSLTASAVIGDYFFCHAGVRPGIALDQQRDVDLLWIRGTFLDSEVDFGKVIVHGHTPAPEPAVRLNRIGIDTGAYATGRLTCLVLDGEEQRFLMTGGSQTAG